MATRLPGFRVRRIAPAAIEEPWVYSTVGAHEAYEGDGVEFLLLAPTESPEHVETLAMVANFHADPRFQLSVGRTVEIGRPWIAGAAADHLLVTLPYPYGPRVESCDVPGRRVQVLWLVPITRAEAGFVAAQGLEAFEQMLEESQVDVISGSRGSLV